MDMKSMPAWRLPKSVEADPQCPRLLRHLVAHTRPLWRLSKIDVPVVMLHAELAKALRNIHTCGQVIRSLEGAAKTLGAEDKGLRMADRQAGAPRGERVSRLILLANDGAERFYRNVETLLDRHGPRILAVRLEMDAGGIGELLFGPGCMARLVLLVHKKAVRSVLLAMAGSPPREPFPEEGVNGPCMGMIA